MTTFICDSTELQIYFNGYFLSSVDVVDISAEVFDELPEDIKNKFPKELQQKLYKEIFKR